MSKFLMVEEESRYFFIYLGGNVITNNGQLLLGDIDISDTYPKYSTNRWGAKYLLPSEFLNV